MIDVVAALRGLATRRPSPRRPATPARPAGCHGDGTGVEPVRSDCLLVEAALSGSS